MNLTSIENLLNSVDGFFYTYLLAALLILAGIYLAARSRLVRLHHFGTIVNSLSGFRSGTQGGISSFQTSTVGLAAHVGIGNVAEVALAIVASGPGALFRMWVVALIGMATSFVESTLAQVFKGRGRDSAFRDDPICYVKNGLESALWGKIFAATCIISVGMAVVMVQANPLTQIISTTVSSVSGQMVGVFLVLLTAPMVLEGVRLMARIAEWLTPIMALAYVLMTVVVIIFNIGRLPEVLGGVLEGAFGLNQTLFGTAGDILTTLLNGMRRGLLSNEVGLGATPNAADTAIVAHPVRQDLIQSFGIFIGTILVCTATGLLILLTTKTYHPDGDSLVGTILTQQAVAEHLGAWTTWPMAVLILVLVLSTVPGCYSYAQVNVDFLGGEHRSEQIFGILLTTAASGGTALTLLVVWALFDTALGLLGVPNLVVIIRLTPWVIGTLRDFESQRARGITEPAFVGHDNFLLPGDVAPGIWEPDDVARRD